MLGKRIWTQKKKKIEHKEKSGKQKDCNGLSDLIPEPSRPEDKQTCLTIQHWGMKTPSKKKKEKRNEFSIEIEVKTNNQ